MKGTKYTQKYKSTQTFRFIYYVRSGQYSREEIYAATIGRNKQSLQALFIEFLFSLGATTVSDHHSGWSGNLKTSYRIG